jgi:dihydroflavonol-4-reductase
MKVFVTGGTGFIGGQVTKRLVESGHEVCCLVRSTTATPLLKGLGVRLAPGDLRDKPSLVDGMAGSEWLINVGAAYSFWTLNPRSYREVNVGGMRNVMEAALETGVSKVVHVSTVVIYGTPAASPVTEDVVPGPVRFSEYARTKYEGEMIAWELYAARGLPLVVVYPGAVLGPGDPKSTGEYIENVMRRRMPATVFDHATFPFVYVNDVADAIARAAAAAGNVGSRYLLVAENLTFGQVNQLIAEIAGVALPRMRMPNALAVGTAAFLTAVARITKRPPLLGLSLDQVRTMSHAPVFDGSKAERELGVRYTPVREALRAAIESYRR